MNKYKFKKIGLTLGLIAVMLLPEVTSAQVFNYNSIGDVLAGFRKTGNNAGLNELVVDLGSITNFLSLPAGTTVNITNYSTTQITNAFVDTGGFQFLQWSAFSQFQFNSSWITPVGTFPKNTLWYTLPASNVNTQTQSPVKNAGGFQSGIKAEINSVGTGAESISGALEITNIDNTPFVVVEPVSYYEQGQGLTLSVYIGNNDSDGLPANIGNFGAGGQPLPNVVENTTPNPFTSAQRDDFYQFVPTGQTDPITGLTNGNAYFVGYFILKPDGSETFTRASSVAPPAAGTITSTVTNGFAPLQAVFTTTATGSITYYVWNFGNGTIITNTTGANVTNTYSSAGDYTVTLTVYGPGGSSTVTVANFIVASPAPVITTSVSSGNFTLSGTNAPVGVAYRILTTTNLTPPIAWTVAQASTFPSSGVFSYSTPATNREAFFELVSP